MVAPTIEQIIKNGGTVVILEKTGTELTASIAGDPTSFTGIAAHRMVSGLAILTFTTRMDEYVLPIMTSTGEQKQIKATNMPC